MLNYGADILHFVGFVLHMVHPCSRFFIVKQKRIRKVIGAS